MAYRSFVLVATLLLPVLAKIKARNEICFDKVGCFSMLPPFGPPARVVPPPQAPEQVCDSVVVYTRETSNETTLIYPTLSPKIRSLFRPSQPTFILCHGFRSTGYDSWTVDTAEALLERLDANIFIVDWQKGAKNTTYFQAVSNSRVAGAVTDLLVQHLVSLGGNTSNFHFIGHSLGAHVLSYVAKRSPTRVSRLTGLDIAKPLFEGMPEEVRFDDGDADYTEAVHTNADYGTFLPMADVDFYVNGGLYQPMCIDFEASKSASPITRDLIVCSHRLARDFYTSAIRNPNCFTVRPAKVENQVVTVTDEECEKVSCPTMGLDTNLLLLGTYAVDTTLNPPYCTL